MKQQYFSPALTLRKGSISPRVPATPERTPSKPISGLSSRDLRDTVGLHIAAYPCGVISDFAGNFISFLASSCKSYHIPFETKNSDTSASFRAPWVWVYQASSCRTCRLPGRYTWGDSWGHCGVSLWRRVSSLYCTFQKSTNFNYKVSSKTLCWKAWEPVGSKGQTVRWKTFGSGQASLSVFKIWCGIFFIFNPKRHFAYDSLTISFSEGGTEENTARSRVIPGSWKSWTE